jgi:hypothetical protein
MKNSVLSVFWASIILGTGFGLMMQVAFAADETVANQNGGDASRVFFENPASFYTYYCAVFPGCSTVVDQSYTAMKMKYSRSEQAGVVHMQADVLVATHKVTLNAYEMELFFDPRKHIIDDVILHDSLCDSRFVIEKNIDTTHGVVKITCGTTKPLATKEAFVPVVSVKYHTTSATADTDLMFGEHTHFCQGDGLGTEAVVWLMDDTIDG